MKDFSIGGQITDQDYKSSFNTFISESNILSPEDEDNKEKLFYFLISYLYILTDKEIGDILEQDTENIKGGKVSALILELENIKFIEKEENTEDSGKKKKSPKIVT